MPRSGPTRAPAVVSDALSSAQLEGKVASLHLVEGPACAALPFSSRACETFALPLAFHASSPDFGLALGKVTAPLMCRWAACFAP